MFSSRAGARNQANMGGAGMLCCSHPPAPGTCTIAAAVLRVSNLHHYVMNLLELGKNREKRQMICMFVKKTFVHVTDPIQAPPLQTPRAPPPAAPHCESGGRRCWQAGLAGFKATHAGSLDHPIKIQPSACAFHHCGLPRPPSSTSTTCLNLTRQPIAGLFLSQPHPPPTSRLQKKCLVP